MEEELGDTLAEVMERMERGTHVTRAWLAAQYPRTWRDLLEALQVESCLHPPPFERAGAYRLGRLVGRGSYGSVYLAQTDATEGSAAPTTQVAVKVLHPLLVEDPGIEERFLAEARIGIALRHPRLVPVVAVGTVSTGGQRRLYMVMELLPGPTLRGRMESAGALPSRVAARFAREVAEGLAALHAAGVVHRDLKPENVILDAAGGARICDLGVAKLVDDALRITSSGRFRATLLYASPEQVEGRAVTPATDLYALGWVLYEMLAGFHPLAGLPREERSAAQALLSPPPLASVAEDVPGALADLVGRLLSKDPASRPASASEVMAALREGAER